MKVFGMNNRKTWKRRSIPARITSFVMAVAMMVTGMPTIAMAGDTGYEIENMSLNISLPSTGEMFPTQITAAEISSDNTSAAYAGNVWTGSDASATGLGVEVHWYKGGVGSSNAVNLSSPAEANTQYTLNVVFTGVADKYLFKDALTSVVFNSNPVAVNTVDIDEDANKATFKHTFTTGEANDNYDTRVLVEKVNVLIDEPVRNHTPRNMLESVELDTSVAADINDKIYIYSTYGGEMGHQMRDVTANTDITEDTPFVPEHAYKLKLHCYSKSATQYYFDDTTEVRINGKLAEKTIESTTQGDISYDGYHLWISYTFIPVEYNRITFNMQGHGIEVPEQGVAFNGNAIQPDEPTEEGYTFSGWFTRPGGQGDLYQFSTPVTSDLVLFALWTKNIHSIYYDVNGANVAATDARFDTKNNIEYGTVLRNPNDDVTYMDMAREGYSFNGWKAYKVNQISVDGDPILGDELDPIPASMPDYDICWKADFTANQYSLNYSNNILTEDARANITDIVWNDIKWLDGSGNELTADQIAESYTNYTVDRDGFVLPVLKAQSKYEFAGWFLGTDSDSKKITQITQGNSDIVPRAGRILTVYPRFKLSTNTLTWDFDGGRLVDESAVYTEAGSVEFGNVIVFPVLERSYYDQTGWTVTYAGGEKDEYTMEQVEQLQTSDNPITMPAEDITITAKWQIHDYYAVYNLGTDGIGGWFSFKSQEAGKEGVIPEWAAKEGEEKVIGTDYFNIDSVPAVKNAGNIEILNDDYVFGGWYASAKNSKYSRYYRGNGTTAPNMDNYPISEGALFRKDKAIFLNGGWDEDDLVTVINEKVIAKAEDDAGGRTVLNLYARWNKDQKTLVWNFISGTPSEDYNPKLTDASVSNEVTVSVGDTITLPTTVTRTGYEFTGWLFFIDNEQTAVPEDELVDKLAYNSYSRTVVMPSKRLIIKAVFTPVKYKITYDLNGKAAWNDTVTPAWSSEGSVEGIDTYTVETYTTDKLRNIDENATITDGYAFVGWYDADDPNYKDDLLALDPDNASEDAYDEDVIGKPVTALTDLVDLDTDTVGDINLIAVWKRAEYKVSWDLDGAVITDAKGFTPAFEAESGKDKYESAAVYGAKITAPDLSGKKTGYSFAGWNMTITNKRGKKVKYTPGNAEAYITVDTTMPAADLTLTAEWKLNEYTIEYFDDQGYGTLADDTPTTYNYLTTLNIPNMVSKKVKYDFKGWYQVRPEDYISNDAQWDESARLSMIPLHTTGDIKLYARWYTRNVSLTWNFDGGTVDTGSTYTNKTTLEYADALIFPKDEEMTKRGYEFNGWIIEALQGGKVTDYKELDRGAAIPAKYTTATSDLAITARWKLIEYNIDYYFGLDEKKNPVGDFTSSQRKSIKYKYTVEEDDYNISDPVVNSRPDIKFVGWYTKKPEGFDENAAWKLTWDNDAQMPKTMPKGKYTGNIELFARWEIDENYSSTVTQQVSNINDALRRLFEKVDSQNNFDMTADFESRLNTALGTYESSWYSVKYGSEAANINDLSRLWIVRDKFNSKVGTMAQEVVEAINNIGEVTYTNACLARIIKARDLFDEYTKIVAIRNKVDTLLPGAANILLEKEALYETLKEKEENDRAMAEAALEKMRAVPNPAQLLDDHKKKIDDAITAYESLTSDQKDLIPPSIVKRVYQALDEYNALARTDADNRQKADNAIKLIDAIPAVVKHADDDKALIDAARKAYDELSDDQKVLVPDSYLQKLKTSEDTYDKLKKSDEDKAFKEAYDKWDDKNTSQKEIEKKIKKTDTDTEDVKGAKFSKLQLKATGRKNSVYLSWKKVKKANGYLVYGAEYGGKMKLLATRKGRNKTSYTHSKLSDDSYYKYIVVAYKDAKKYNDKSILTTSDTVYASPSGGVYNNPATITVSSNQTSIRVKKGDTFQYRVNVTFMGKDKPLVGTRFESTKKSVASIDKNGYVTCKKSGKAIVYAVAQNGMTVKLKVIVTNS